jgi:hypothetical protein
LLVLAMMSVRTWSVVRSSPSRTKLAAGMVAATAAGVPARYAVSTAA